LWVRVPRLPLKIVRPWCNGSMTGSNPVGQGSNPWGRALRRPACRRTDGPVAQRRGQLPYKETIGGSSPPRTTWRGRQLADHLGLEPGMSTNASRRCPVRLPPGPLQTIRPRGAARSARHPVTVEAMGSNPIGDALTARYANRKSGQAQTLVIVGSTPTCATCWVVLLAAACKAVVTKQAGWATRGSIPSRPT
jgi:hypothetical protein